MGREKPLKTYVKFVALTAVLLRIQVFQDCNCVRSAVCDIFQDHLTPRR
jgi:hypothetical protein